MRSAGALERSSYSLSCHVLGAKWTNIPTSRSCQSCWAGVGRASGESPTTRRPDQGRTAGRANPAASSCESASLRVGMYPAHLARGPWHGSRAPPICHALPLPGGATPPDWLRYFSLSLMEDKRMRLRVTLAVMGGALLAVACSDSSNP